MTQVVSRLTAGRPNTTRMAPADMDMTAAAALPMVEAVNSPLPAAAAGVMRADVTRLITTDMDLTGAVPRNVAQEQPDEPAKNMEMKRLTCGTGNTDQTKITAADMDLTEVADFVEDYETAVDPPVPVVINDPFSADHDDRSRSRSLGVSQSDILRQRFPSPTPDDDLAPERTEGMVGPVTGLVGDITSFFPRDQYESTRRAPAIRG